MPVNMQMFNLWNKASHDENEVQWKDKKDAYQARFLEDEGLMLLMNTFLQLAVRDQKPVFAEDIPNPFFMRESYSAAEVIQALPEQWRRAIGPDQIKARFDLIRRDPRFQSSGDEALFWIRPVPGGPLYEMRPDCLTYYVNESGEIR